MDRGHPRLRAGVQFDRDAGIDENALEHLFDRFRRGFEAEAARAIGAFEDQRQAGGAVFEVVQRLRVGLGGVGMVDALHDLPRRAIGPAGDRRGILGAGIERLNLDAVIGLADEFLERRALQHAIDQLSPVVVTGGCKIRGQREVVHRSRH